MNWVCLILAGVFEMSLLRILCIGLVPSSAAGLKLVG